MQFTSERTAQLVKSDLADLTANQSGIRVLLTPEIVQSRRSYVDIPVLAEATCFWGHSLGHS